ncbi:MAG: formamidopyrimidine-DNA glycosylase, formamidopyrimidine-DNA glycosylase [Candidatus Woesebacteria bacterium GW2011_GWC1_38_13]|uniref:Formamidopyrimidine-DNA glycosylase, formamidopyrimidine-DNA glycosylase n=1 Tax=Candidatus Woesebacteria bacterium GW2011_GWC1_38_13 TaxID=1618583 RepID=A0A0G0LR11_9BACT|nr:MAG: formamidopyrimidine-DNA glycosylase, formamidopyrimidine-DNA glycosylase [Candidatus Woesebacteria bacterium GW2011_GWC1_38_13]
MPELPEVESIKIQLEKFLVGSPRGGALRGSPRGGALRGHIIKKLEIRNPKYEIEKEKIENTKITGVRRFGKVLVIDLSSNYSIVTHVKMTGQFIYQGPNLLNVKSLSHKVVGGLGGKHTHVIFHLDRGGVLYFNDYRRFGWMRLEKTSNIQNSKNPNNYIGKLGKEFLKDLTLEEFSEILVKSKKPIKILLMDQTKMAGVGNIYANDALWLAMINPRKQANKLLNYQIIKLLKSVEKVLKEGIKRGGASELAYVAPDGSEGHYQDFTLVYGREKEPCKNCKTPIEKVKLGGRGTYFCPVCQK